MGKRIIDRVDFDDLWENPEQTWQSLADRLNIKPRSLSDALRRAGWYKGLAGELQKAPCAECGSSYDIEDLSSDRICSKCEKTRDPQYEEELRKFLQRNPHMSSSVENPPPGF